MAELVIPSGYARLTLTGANAGSGLGFTAHFDIQNGPDIMDPTAFNDLAFGLMSDFAGFYEDADQVLHCHGLINDGGLMKTMDSPVTPVSGARSFSDRCSPRVQIVMRKQTALAGAAHRGRTFIGTVAETDVDATGQVAPGIQSDFNSVGESIAIGLNGGYSEATASFVLLHTTEYAEPEDVDLVTVYSCAPFVRTLRGRQAA